MNIFIELERFHYYYARGHENPIQHNVITL